MTAEAPARPKWTRRDMDQRLILLLVSAEHALLVARRYRDTIRGGDAAQREGTYLYANGYLDGVKAALKAVDE